MKRLDRVTAILIQLQSKRIVKAQEIADRFGISLRTVYRDIKTLDDAGIPLISEAGVGYSIMDGYRLPPVMFTIEEATAFITAEKLIEKLTDSGIEESYKSAMYKIKAVLRSAEKDYLENIDDSIEVLKNPFIPETNHAANQLQTILKSISDKAIISINYFANHNQQNTERNIEPIGVFFSAGKWHLIAFCQLRNDYRDFRLDRISKIISTKNKFNKEHLTLKNYLQKLSFERELFTVVIKVDKEIINQFGEQKFYNGFVSEKELDDVFEMTFLSGSLEGFARFYIMFGDRAAIISPESLKTIVHNIAKVLLKRN